MTLTMNKEFLHSFVLLPSPVCSVLFVNINATESHKKVQ